MKRQRFFLFVALLFVGGAALWGVNYRLNNPPLSDADKQFRALVAGVDSVKISQWTCFGCAPCFATGEKPLKTLDAVQTRELVKCLRLTNIRTAKGTNCSSVPLEIYFKRNNKVLTYFTLGQTLRTSQLNPGRGGEIAGSRQINYQLHPRFEKPLRQFLDRIAPKRIRP